LNTLLVYLDQDELVLVTIQPDFASRDMTGALRRIAYVDRRLQSFPHLRASDLPPEAATLEVRPARSDCRYVEVDDEVLRQLRGLEMTRAAELALDGASPQDAARELNAAIAAIPAFLLAERDKLRDATPGAYEAWSTAASLALLEESHADLAARIRAASHALDAHALDAHAPDPARPGEAAARPAMPSLAPDIDDHAAPSGIWRRFYDRRPMG
jgi:hypothetical protein